MSSEILSGLIGGFFGGVLGVVGTIFSSYYGPRKLEEWRGKRREEKVDGPRKQLLAQLLEGDKYEIRSIETLCMATGTKPEECRRLLIEIKARGIRMKGNREGWVLIRNKPLSELNDDEVFDG